MSKLNIGVGEEFPLQDDGANNERSANRCAQWRRERHLRHHPAHAAKVFVALPLAAASVTAAILYPLSTLGLFAGLGLVAAAHRHGAGYRDEYRRSYPGDRDGRGRRDSGPAPDAPTSTPKEGE